MGRMHGNYGSTMILTIAPKFMDRFSAGLGIATKMNDPQNPRASSAGDI